MHRRRTHDVYTCMMIDSGKYGYMHRKQDQRNMLKKYLIPQHGGAMSAPPIPLDWRAASRLRFSSSAVWSFCPRAVRPIWAVTVAVEELGREWHHFATFGSPAQVFQIKNFPTCQLADLNMRCPTIHQYILGAVTTGGVNFFVRTSTPLIVPESYIFVFFFFNSP